MAFKKNQPTVGVKTTASAAAPEPPEQEDENAEDVVTGTENQTPGSDAPVDDGRPAFRPTGPAQPAQVPAGLARARAAAAGEADTQAVENLRSAETAQTANVNRIAEADRARQGVINPDVTLFVSARPEAEAFDIRLGTEEDEVVRSYYDAALEYLVWRVPNKLLPRFKRHVFVTQSRIIEANPKAE